VTTFEKFIHDWREKNMATVEQAAAAHSFASMTATYSPEDNKLRLYSLSRLDSETYARVKAAGFRWAPKQDLFVAPMWTPEREDLLIELAGEIGDEDTSLAERQEQRAERFSGYKENRTADAERAHAHVDSISERFAGGQPILVGHHSERGARRDAERIENGMRKALKMWETAEYWKQRAAGAIAHAKYKERPTVRARRIKTLEAEQRKVQRERDHLLTSLNFWTAETIELEAAKTFCNFHDRGGCRLVDGERYWSAWGALDDGKITVEQLKLQRLNALPRVMGRLDRWINHYTNRLEYERAMLAEDGATHLLDPKPRPKQLPLCNYRAPEGLDVQSPYRSEPMHLSQIEMTQAEYAAISTDYKGTRTVGNSHRVRTAMRKMGLHCVFLTDAKIHTPPEPIQPEPVSEPTQRETVHRETSEAEQKARQLRQQLKAGVQIAVAPQLFPTPPDLASRMVELAGLEPGMTVLEPSAGTGNILRAILQDHPEGLTMTAIEQDERLARLLGQLFPNLPTAAMDFLETKEEFTGRFDRILMNPPFAGAQDVEHINHAITLLKPGGRIVAICANGPRQQEALQPLANFWEPLPPGTFKESGTNVNTVLLTIEGRSADGA